jgi:hypothetical protein
VPENYQEIFENVDAHTKTAEMRIVKLIALVRAWLNDDPKNAAIDANRAKKLFRDERDRLNDRRLDDPDVVSRAILLALEAVIEIPAHKVTKRRADGSANWMPKFFKLLENTSIHQALYQAPQAQESELEGQDQGDITPQDEEARRLLLEARDWDLELSAQEIALVRQHDAKMMKLVCEAIAQQKFAAEVDRRYHFQVTRVAREVYALIGERIHIQEPCPACFSPLIYVDHVGLKHCVLCEPQQSWSQSVRTEAQLLIAAIKTHDQIMTDLMEEQGYPDGQDESQPDQS